MRKAEESKTIRIRPDSSSSICHSRRVVVRAAFSPARLTSWVRQVRDGTSSHSHSADRVTPCSSRFGARSRGSAVPGTKGVGKGT